MFTWKKKGINSLPRNKFTSTPNFGHIQSRGVIYRPWPSFPSSFWLMVDVHVVECCMKICVVQVYLIHSLVQNGCFQVWKRWTDICYLFISVWIWLSLFQGVELKLCMVHVLFLFITCVPLKDHKELQPQPFCCMLHINISLIAHRFNYIKFL